MNTYPGFYRTPDGYIYLQSDKDKYYSFACQMWAIGEDEDHKKDTNITREYLANTNVKIKSKGHEAFVRGLASNANLSCVIINGTAFIFERDIEDAIKEIHIPLPPKESKLPEANSGAPMPEVKESKKVSMNDIQVNVKNNTDSVVQVTKSDDESNIFICVSDLPKEPKPKEWPQVGDEACCGSLLNICTVEALCKGFAWVSYKEGNLETASISSLIKPLTPEDELKENLTEITDKYRNQELSIQEIIAKAIINGEIKCLSYKPE